MRGAMCSAVSRSRYVLSQKYLLAGRQQQDAANLI